MRDGETYTLRARRVAAMLPDREIIGDGAIVVRGGLVAEAGSFRELKSRCPAPVRDLGEATLLPGLINSHTHLELSHLGLPPTLGQGFLAWLRWLLAQPVSDVNEASLDKAAGQLTACATAAAADIGNRSPGLVARCVTRHGIEILTQFEQFGFGKDMSLPELPSIPPDRLALAGHALYSTSPEILRQAKSWDQERDRTFSIHLAEHEGEVELLADGHGDFADFLRSRILPKDFAPPGLSPVAYADTLNLLDHKTLAVHGVHVSKADIGILASRGTAVCLCPRSNRVIGVGRAPARAYLDAGVPVCLGTDSLASTPDLDLWEELRALLGFTSLTLCEAARMLATAPARLFGFAGLGDLRPGKLARTAVLPSQLEPLLGD